MLGSALADGNWWDVDDDPNWKQGLWPGQSDYVGPATFWPRQWLDVQTTTLAMVYAWDYTNNQEYWTEDYSVDFSALLGVDKNETWAAYLYDYEVGGWIGVVSLMKIEWL
jgi:hypothetical protein